MNIDKLIGLGRDWGLAVGACILIVFVWNACTMFGPRSSGTAPDFTLTDVAGGTWTLSSAKRTVVLNFWATWCGPCMAEIPEFVEYQAAYPEVAVVGVSLDKKAPQSKLAAVARRKGINYTILHDASNRVGLKYGVSTLPTTIVVDAEQQIVASRTGTLTAERLEDLVLTSIAKP